MKFGHSFHRLQHPDWAPYYINYDNAKRLFKVACTTAQEEEQGNDADFTELFAALDCELSKVEAFYVRKFSIVAKTATLLYAQYGTNLTEAAGPSPAPDWNRVDPFELDDVRARSVELFQEYEKVLWYGKLNRDGFRNVLRKVDNRARLTPASGNAAASSHRLAERLDGLNFAGQRQCLADLASVSKIVATLSQASSVEDGESASSNKHVSLALKSFCALHAHSLAPDELYQAIVADDISALDNLLAKNGYEAQALGSSRHVLLQCALLQGSRNCTRGLMSALRPSWKDTTFADGGSYLHRLPLSIWGRKQIKSSKNHEHESAIPPDSPDENATGFPLWAEVLEWLRSDQQRALLETDRFGRLPLHYAAAYGVSELCEGYLKFTPDQPATTALFQDTESHTPLHLAVIGGHVAATRILIEACTQNDEREKSTDVNLNNILGPLLTIAVRSDFVDIIHMLLACGASTRHVDPSKETALYIAARNGHEEIVKALLAHPSFLHEDLNARETIHGWTPLFVASVQNHLPIVQQLLDAGADETLRDFSGWTVADHATFRGHLKVAWWLTSRGEKDPTLLSGTKDLARTRRPTARGVKRGMNRAITALRPSGANGHWEPTQATQSHVLVTLGDASTRRARKALDLSPDFVGHSYAAHPEAGYSLKVSATGATGSSPVIELPILDERINEPLLFTTSDPDNVRLVFKVYRITDYSEESTVWIGSGVADLSSLKEGSTPKHESLIRDYTVPILEKRNLNPIGSVTFGFTLVTPLPHLPISPSAGLWKEGGPTQIVGHRGSGANTVARTNLQIGENTVRSFMSAAALGATSVEFDVQLTKDLVPVIYHDFAVIKTGTDTPVHDLTLDQFMHLGRSQASRGGLTGMAETRYLDRDKREEAQPRKSRSNSLGEYDDYRADDFVQRMKLTEEGMLHGIKGNVRGQAIHEPSSTLEELLMQLPESIAFDVELKYPMLWEAEDRHMQLTAIELNVFVDAILIQLFRLGGKRNITLSSFSPEICILLQIKQNTFPVLMINKAGAMPVGDARAGGTQQAIQFSKRWGLAGIVMLSHPFVWCPSLIGYARSVGLITGSFGNLNDEPRNAMLQVDAGLDALVVNKVRLISETVAASTKPCP